MNENIHRINDIIKQVPGLKYDCSVGNFECYRKDLYDFAILIINECAACCGSQADMRNIKKRFGLPVESNIKYPGPEAQGHHSQYGREYNIPK